MFTIKFTNFSPYGRQNCMNGPVDNIAITVPIPTVPPNINPIIKNPPSKAILIQRYSTLV